MGGEQRVGSKSHAPFIRITIDHIAVTLPDDDKAYKRVVDNIDGLLKKHVGDRGYECEFHVNETERRLWMVNGEFCVRIEEFECDVMWCWKDADGVVVGYIPPAFGSEGEKIWAKENKAVEYESRVNGGS